jgi:hypothetical protein
MGRAMKKHSAVTGEGVVARRKVGIEQHVYALVTVSEALYAFATGGKNGS